jgi:hypothetical protein
MGGYIGSKAVALSTTGADINGDAIVDGTLDVLGAFTSLGIDDNATSTAITINASGYVGLNYDNPSILGTLVFKQKAVSRGLAIIDSSGTNTFFVENNTTATNIINNDAIPMIFGTNSTDRMWLTSSGNVGIGTAAPLNRFVVAEGTNQHGIEIIPGTTSYIQAYDRATSDYSDLKIDAQTIAFSTDNGSERMRIDASGNVAVLGSGSINLRDDGSFIRENGGLLIGNTNGTGTTRPIRFYTESVERMTIDALGRLGLGTTTPNSFLAGTFGQVIAGNSPGLSLHSLMTGQTWLTYVNSGNSAYDFFNVLAGRTEAFLDTNGAFYNRSGVYGTISDNRYKQDIVDSGSQWDDVKALQFKKYRLIDDVIADPDSAPVMMGVIAQDLEASGMSGLVEEAAHSTTDENGNIVDTGETRKTVKYSILYMKSVKALQEAMGRIEALEAQNAAFETRLTALEAKP